MTIARIALTLLALVPAVSAQSVVSTHSGVVYFFSGAVFIGDDRLEQKFGKFPDIGEGRQLRTETGRAEVLLTPGVILRVAENSAIRMLSSKLSDTRVELISGSVIVESNEASKNTAVALIYKNWRARVPHQAVYRLDAAPAQVRVYKGEVEVSGQGEKTTPVTDPVTVKEGDVLPLAEVLVTDRSNGPEGDSFKSWALNRSQAVAADNATAAGIIDDPTQFDSAGVALGSLTYFPPTGIPALGITNPYGLSFWSSYQSMLGGIYLPTYLYGPGFGYAGGHGVVRGGWPSSYSSSPSGLVHPRQGYPTPIVAPWRLGGAVHSPGITTPRPSYTPSPRMPMPSHVPSPPAAIHAPVHR